MVESPMPAMEMVIANCVDPKKSTKKGNTHCKSCRCVSKSYLIISALMIQKQKSIVLVIEWIKRFHRMFKTAFKKI